MFSRHHRVKLAILLLFIIYALTGVFSSFNFSARLSIILCGLLTLTIVYSCFHMFVRCVSLALLIERATNWKCKCVCRDSAKQIMLSCSFLMGFTGLLKLWSVHEIFITHWADAPWAYHAQSWAYLAQNATTIIICWVVTNTFVLKYNCANRSGLCCSTTEVK